MRGARDRRIGRTRLHFFFFGFNSIFATRLLDTAQHFFMSLCSVAPTVWGGKLKQFATDVCRPPAAVHHTEGSDDGRRLRANPCEKFQKKTNPQTHTHARVHSQTEAINYRKREREK